MNNMLYYSLIRNTLLSFVGKHMRQWYVMLAYAELAYNNWVSQYTGKCPLEVVYGQYPF